MRGVEREIAASGRRAARGAGIRPGAKVADPTKAFKEIGKVAAREEMRRHRLAMRNQEREKRRNMRGIAEIGRAVRAAEMKRHRDAIRNAEREASKRVRNAQKTGRAGAGVLGRSVRGVATIGGGVLGIGGGMLVAGQMQTATELERRQRQVIINARGPGERGAISPGNLRDKIAATSIATGAAQLDITAGIEEFVTKTGDIKTAIANMEVFAKVAMATGASVGDIAAAAAELSDKFDLTDPKEMADALAALAFQGKRGAFELRDMAAQFPKIGAAAQRFGFKGAAGVRELGGLAQIARKGTGTGEEAGTAIENMLKEIIAKSTAIQEGTAFGFKKREGKGVQVFEDFDPKKAALRASDTITNIIAASGGNIVQLQKIFGTRGTRAISPLSTAFREAAGAAGGGEKGKAAGIAAIRAELAAAIEGKGDFADIEKDAADAAKSLSAEMTKLQTVFNKALTKEMIPALKLMIPELEKAAPHLAKLAVHFAEFVAWFAANPIKGLGALVLGKIGMDLAAAGIGAAVAKVITKILLLRGGAAAGGAVVAQVAGGAVAGQIAGGAGGAVAAGAGGRIMGTAAGSALGAAAGRMAIKTGSVAIAAGAVYMAQQQNEELKKVTGGKGIFDVLKDVAETGSFRGAFERISNAEDEAARREAKQRDMETPGTAPADVSADKQKTAAETNLEAAKLNKEAADKNLAASGVKPERTGTPIVAR